MERHMNKFKEHIFNASYLAIFLYGMRRIVRRIRPISFDDAYSLVEEIHAHLERETEASK
jgi:hypothetical protein